VKSILLTMQSGCFNGFLSVFIDKGFVRDNFDFIFAEQLKRDNY